MKLFGKSHLIFVLGFSILALQLWVSSGTLYPYAYTLHEPLVDSVCGYLFNIDHKIMLSSLNMFGDAFNFTDITMLYWHRPLYPALLYPVAKILGVLWGALLLNFLIHSFSIFLFISFLKKHYGEAVAKASFWLCIFYPGIYYWGATPYVHTLIVPITLFCFMYLSHLKKMNFVQMTVWTLGLGGLFLGYDLFAIFAPASFLLLLFYRQYKKIPFLILLIIPTIIWNLTLQKYWNRPPVNSLTQTYLTLLLSYLGPESWSLWLKNMIKFPWILFKTFLYSNFFVIPISVILILWSKRKQFKMIWGVSSSIAISILILFSFINLSPPSIDPVGWDFHGTWIARIYQPLFIILIIFLAKYFAELKLEQKYKNFLMVVFFSLNIAIIWGPLLNLRVAHYVYLKFYKHGNGKPALIQENLRRHGTRPLGFCRNTKIKIR